MSATRQWLGRALRGTLLSLAALALAGCCCSSAELEKVAAEAEKAQAAEEKNRANKKTRKVSMRKLIGAYAKDSRAAARKYTGRKIKTTGYVLETGEGTFAESVLILGPDPDSDVLEDDLVQCRVPEARNADALEVEPGTKVSIRGDCEGFYLDRVRIEECRWKVLED